MNEAKRAPRQAPMTVTVTGRRRFSSPAAVAVLGIIALVLVSASIPLASVTHQLTGPAETVLAAQALAAAAVGVVVAYHQPRNPVGWALIAFTVLVMLSNDAGYYAVLCYRLGHPGLPFAAAAVLLVPLWFPAAAVFALVVLLFPDGHLTPRYWRWVVWVYGGLVAGYTAFSFAGTIAAVAGHHIRLDSAGDVASTQHLPTWLGVIIVLPIGVIWLSFVAYQVLSWRRASGERRQQLKWLATGAAVTLGVGILGSSLVPGPLGQALAFAIVALPAGIGVGILKYRLYEIDRLVSRTLAYAIVTAVLVGVYTGLVLVATRVLPFSSPVAVAASTLAVAALFSPLRRRVQRAVDRRFNRARYDADKTVDAFAGRLKDAVDLDMIRDDMADVVRQALEPTRISVWIRPAE
jgi:hypothetical protein